MEFVQAAGFPQGFSHISPAKVIESVGKTHTHTHTDCVNSPKALKGLPGFKWIARFGMKYIFWREACKLTGNSVFDFPLHLEGVDINGPVSYDSSTGNSSVRLAKPIFMVILSASDKLGACKYICRCPPAPWWILKNCILEGGEREREMTVWHFSSLQTRLSHLSFTWHRSGSNKGTPEHFEQWGLHQVKTKISLAILR